MNRFDVMRRLVAVMLVLVSIATAVEAQWPPKEFTNLKVLPSDISQDELIGMMGGFTRALGVRCTYCHVGDEDLPLSTYHFAADDKPTKRKARVMLRMMNDLNAKYLPSLEQRVDPPVRIRCITCHHGATVPRSLEEVLLDTHASHGLDSTLARYRALRERYYGRATYDFGSVPLADVASEVAERGRPEDAVVLNALNVEMNPESEFARRQYASSAVRQAFRHDGIDSATVLYRELRARFGPSVFPEFALNRMGYELLGEGHVEHAIAAFELNAEAFPGSANAHDSLGDAYAQHGDRTLAIASYERALSLAPTNEATRKKLEELRSKGK